MAGVQQMNGLLGQAVAKSATATGAVATVHNTGSAAVAFTLTWIATAV